MKEMLKAGKILIFFFLFMPLMVHAQFYSEGENPTSIRWNQINTEHFQLIFDENAKALNNIPFLMENFSEEFLIRINPEFRESKFTPEEIVFEVKYFEIRKMMM